MLSTCVLSAVGTSAGEPVPSPSTQVTSPQSPISGYPTMSLCLSSEPRQGTPTCTCLTPRAGHLCLGRALRRPSFSPDAWPLLEGAESGHSVDPGGQARPVCFSLTLYVGGQWMGVWGWAGKKLQGRSHFCWSSSCQALSFPPSSLVLRYLPSWNSASLPLLAPIPSQPLFSTFKQRSQAPGLLS